MSNWQTDSADESELAQPRVFVAAFGKHPGWDDHIDDIGVETEGLAAFKRMLYVNGVGGNIDSGAWERLEEHQRVDGFHHTFLRVGEEGAILGRMWSSSDGKGRKRYPMVVCVACPSVPLPWMLEEVTPRLASVEESCRSATTATDVRACLGLLRAELVRAVGGGAADDHALPPWFDSLNPVELLEGPGGDTTGFQRVLYKVEREMAAFVGGAGDGDGVAVAQPQHIRVPLIGEAEAPAYAVWLGVMLGLVARRAPIFLSRHVQKAWIDIIVGEPRAQQLYCLLASREAIPVATDVPYTLPDGYAEHAAALLAGWLSGAPDMRRLIVDASAPCRTEDGLAGVRRLFSHVRGLFGGK